MSNAVRWVALPGHEGQLELSDARAVRRISPWRGIGDTIRLEPVLPDDEVMRLGLDIEALAVEIWGAPVVDKSARAIKAVTTTLVPASKDVADDEDSAADGEDDSGEDVDPEKPAKKPRARKGR